MSNGRQSLRLICPLSWTHWLSLSTTMATTRVPGKHIQRALAGAPDNPSMRYHQAMIDAALGEKDKAIAVLQEVACQRRRRVSRAGRG